jgi:hypothetical protein
MMTRRSDDEKEEEKRQKVDVAFFKEHKSTQDEGSRHSGSSGTGRKRN